MENDIIPCVLSDHDYVTLHLQIKKQKIGPSYWKFNNSLLNNQEYVVTLNEKFQEWVNEYVKKDDKKMLWDCLKFKIREFTIPFSKKKKCEKERKREKLEEELKRICEIDQADMKEEHMSKKKEIEEELTIIYDYFADGAILRSRSTWYEKGEKSTKYFLSLERSQAESTNIDVLNVDGRITKNPTDIRNFVKTSFQNFFENKDQVDSESCLEYISQCKIEQITEEEKASFEGKITCAEARKELLKMAKNKTPGNDGLTVEFYETFWPLVSQHLVAAFNLAYEDQIMSVSQRQGVIKLIPKPKKEKQELGNWRPITLINVDTKIISKCLAKRISKVIGKLINCQQTAFIKGRYIGEGIRLISDIMFCTEKENIEGMILALDLTKAFDCLSHQYIIKCLQALNFGNSLIQWVKILYNDISSCVLINGFTTGYFNVCRGVRQGDPLAPFLFILSLEVFLCRLSNNEMIRGLDIYGQEVKYTAYADDITCFCRNKESVRNILEDFEVFSKISGLCISKSKTEGMWIGANRSIGEKCQEIIWPEKGIKILGNLFFLWTRTRLKEGTLILGMQK